MVVSLLSQGLNTLFKGTGMSFVLLLSQISLLRQGLNTLFKGIGMSFVLLLSQGLKNF